MLKQVISEHSKLSSGLDAYCFFKSAWAYFRLDWSAFSCWEVVTTDKAADRCALTTYP